MATPKAETAAGIAIATVIAIGTKIVNAAMEAVNNKTTAADKDVFADTDHVIGIGMRQGIAEPWNSPAIRLKSMAFSRWPQKDLAF
jgi:hypothetical protein